MGPRGRVYRAAAILFIATLSLSIVTTSAPDAIAIQAPLGIDGDFVDDREKVTIFGDEKSERRSSKPGPVKVKGKNPKAPSKGSGSSESRGPKFLWDTKTVCDVPVSNKATDALRDSCNVFGNYACTLEKRNSVYAIGLGGDGSKPRACISTRQNTSPGNANNTTPAPPPPPTISTQDFQSLTIPASTLKSQLGGFTLKGAHTNLYADGGQQTLNTIVLNQPVTIRATPISYTFTYGDGTKLTTKNPGSPTPGNGFDIKTTTSHIYTKTGIFTATLSTAYTGEFSVNGGPYQPIPGTANVTSTPLDIDVWRTKHYRVAQPCTKNNTAPGCTPHN